MNLSFVTDSKIFSKAVEELRREKLAITSETIKERYDLLSKGKKEVVPEVEAEEAPKKEKKAKAPKK